MLTRIVEESLSDGSSVYNLIIDDPSTDQQLTLHCTDMEAAVRLDKMLAELTVDFISIGDKYPLYAKPRKGKAESNKTRTTRQCVDCRNGEHPNYDDNVKLVHIRDPETGKICKRAYLCQEHQEMYASDGFIVKLC